MNSDEYLADCRKQWDDAGRKIEELRWKVDAKIAAGETKEAALSVIEKLVIGIEMLAALLPNASTEVAAAKAGLAALAEMAK